MLLAAAAAFGPRLDAQLFNIRFQQGQNVSTIADTGTATMAADAIGAPVSGLLTLQYRGTAANISINTVDVFGSQDFTLTSDAPVTLNLNATTQIPVRFTPTASARANARVVIAYQEGRTTGSVTINLVGVTPEFVFSYTAPQGNATPLTDGGRIVFPALAIDQTSSAAVVALNRGSGAGIVKSISGSGDAAFQLVNLPLPNVSVDPGQSIRFNINFTPKLPAPVAGRGSIELFNSRVGFSYEGSGTQDEYVYETVGQGAPTPLVPDQVVALPDALVGEKSQIVVRFRNTGNVEGNIAAINIAGTAFTLLEAPFTPLRLAPGAGASLTVQFTPRESGRAVGKLRIGNHSFDLGGNGLAPVVTYSFSAGGVTTQVQNSGAVIFAPVTVGATGRLTFEVANTGTAPTTVNSVSLASVTSGFELASLPQLPLQLEAGGSTRFTVAFVPTAVGAATTTLRVDTATFALNATGTQPPPLPGYRFDGAAGNVGPVEQPAVGLVLAQNYPLTLNGTLTMAFNSDVFSNDPTVQFATGSRAINFTIPANTTRAIFANGAQQVRLQTGTVAGNITLTPSFVTDGGIVLTPTRPDFLALTLPSSGPVLLNAGLLSKTANTITLQLTGYAPTRSITQIDLRFTPFSGENVSTTQLTLNVESSFQAWYQSTASQAFGSQFTVTIPLTLAGDVIGTTTTSSVADTVQSIAVTIGNRNGTSQSRTVPVRQ